MITTSEAMLSGALIACCRLSKVPISMHLPIWQSAGPKKEINPNRTDRCSIGRAVVNFETWEKLPTEPKFRNFYDYFLHIWALLWSF